jgi:RNA polymerase sigma factor (sigma-70 family)
MALAQTDIATLVQGCQQGQAAAQRTVVQRFAPLLMTVARRYARNHAEAQDILQEAFIRIFDKVHTYDAERGSFPTWMQRIVANTAVSFYRKFHFTHEKGADVLPDHTEMAPDVLSKLGMEALIEMIASLPDGERQVFNLAVFDHFSHDEIAAMLGIAAGTSRSLLSRARKALQAKITQQTHELARI